MRPSLAWLNTRHRARRSAVAVAGIAFAVLLLFMQSGFLAAARTNVTRPLAFFAGELVLTDRSYLSLSRSGHIDRARLARAAAVPGVARAVPLLVEFATWRNPRTGGGAGALLFGVSPELPAFADTALNAQLVRLRPLLSALGDRLCRPSYGPWRVGDEAELNGKRITLVGDYGLGLGLLADGGAVVSEETFERLLWPGARDRPNLAFLQLAPGADPAAVAADLRAALPPDVRVVPRAELLRHEEGYFLTVKPVGIIFQVGMAVAFVAGAALLYQALAADVLDRLPEYALMKALGHSAWSIYAVGLQQALLFAGLAFVPAFALAVAFGAVARRLSGFPVAFTWSHTTALLAATLLMAALAAALALGKIRRADPAALYTR